MAGKLANMKKAISCSSDFMRSIDLDLPERNREIKRSKQFIEYTSYIEDRMMKFK